LSVLAYDHHRVLPSFPTRRSSDLDAYDVAYLPQEAGFLAAYSSTAVSMRSVAGVIAGTITPTGRLPVDVPAADGSVLYPIGAGLSWPAERLNSSHVKISYAVFCLK